MTRQSNKRGQISLNDAPSIIIIIGLTFLVMATLAFVSSKYGDAMPSSNSVTVRNETLTTVNYAGEYVSNRTACNFEDFTVTTVQNATGGTVITAGNYTVVSDGRIYSKTNGPYNNTNWNVTYTYSYAGVGCTVNQDLQTEISNNTSIAGIVLTISLVGIVLSVLVGVFVLARRKGL